MALDLFVLRVRLVVCIIYTLNDFNEKGKISIESTDRSPSLCTLMVSMNMILKADAAKSL